MTLAGLRHALRARWIPMLLAALAYAVALLQRPGAGAADTKIDLHVDPTGFLADVASIWSSSGGLGQVQAGQYAGYLFPMGPFYALGHELGLSPWLVQRLWLGTLLALAAWGVVRLLDAMLERPRGAAHLAAGAVTVVNPYVVVFANRTSITLLGYAALPWLLLAVQRGVRVPRGWRWPAAFGLLIACTGGGVNAAVTGWLLLGPLLLAVWEPLTRACRAVDAWSFAWRAALLSVLVSLWWVVPVAAHARYGLNFLPFTESVGSIWDSTSLSESLRLMGYWIAYHGVGFGDSLVPYFSDASTLLFEPVVVVAGLLVPALALAGFAWTRRLRYAPFFAALALLGLVVMAAGFPPGTPLRRGITYVYNHAEAVQFLRTTYKAGALPAIAIACLAGMAAGELAGRFAGRRALTALFCAAIAALLAVASWPLTEGRAIDDRVAYGDVPQAWRAAAADLDRELPPNSRALVLPGQVFAFYEWGGTQDPILPALSERPVAIRSIVPYADLHAADLLLTTDALVQQGRAFPGQLPALLRLLGVRAVVSGTDDDRLLSGAIEPAAAERVLREGGLPGPARRYGPGRVAVEPGEPAVRLPQVRRTDLGAGRGLVRVAPAGPELVLDGSAEGVASLAAFGALPATAPILYAGDNGDSELRAAARRGAHFVVTDSNRRRVFVSSHPRQNVGATLARDDPISEDGAELNPVAARGSDGQTVAEYTGVRSVRSPFSPHFPQFPEHRPYAALDGDPATWWEADRYLDVGRHWLEVRFERPRDVAYVELLASTAGGGRVTAVEVAGRTLPLRPGWNRMRLGLRGVGDLRVRIAGLLGPGPGGLAELRVPGLRVRERLRPPRLVERSLAGAGLERSALTYVFSRSTGDDPFRRGPEAALDAAADPVGGGDRAAVNRRIESPGDGERALVRMIEPPAPRSFTADAWITLAPDASDRLIDRMAGSAGQVEFESSSRRRGLPRHRASRAFDGDDSTAWVADEGRGAWIGWRAPAPVEVASLRFEPAGGEAVLPERVRVGAAGDESEPLPVSAAGDVRLPEPVTTDELRVEAVGVPAAAQSALRPVGAAEVRVVDAAGEDAFAAAGLVAPPAADLPEPGGPAPPSVGGELRAGCQVVVRVGGRELRLAPYGLVADLEAGRPLRAGQCGRSLELPRGRTELAVEDGPFRVDLLRLHSTAPAGDPPERGGGRVLDPGHPGRGSYDDVRLALDGPAWLVLGESFNRGWRAWCDGRDLGEPEPVDGYANGWRVGPGCREARFAFAPNTAAKVAYAISGAAVLAMLALLLGGRGARSAGVPPPAAPAEHGAPRTPLVRALAIGLAAALAGGFLFGLRAGVVIGPALAFVLWRGIGARALALAGGLLLVAVLPLLYLIGLPEDRGGYNTDYAKDLVEAHWVALAGLLLIGLAAWRTVVARRWVNKASRPSDAPTGERSGAAAAGSRA